MTTSTHIKDPNATLDYASDWSSWLAEGDSISNFDVVVESGDVVIEDGTGTAPAPSETDGVVTAWISGGTVGTTATVRYRVTTAQGRIDDRTVFFIIRER